jgi:hypothetical protein
MATESWRDAAQAYNLLNESARAEYWRQLTPEQQEALRGALASLQAEAAASPASPTRQPAPARSGCGGPLAAGCLGVILGVVLTIGAEIVAVMMGAQAVGDAFNKVSRGSSWGSHSDRSQPKIPSTRETEDNVISPNDRLLSYCGTPRESSDSKVAAACADARRDHKLREDMNKAKSEN